jgi:DNA-binding transcriptional ArsR family regulator
MREFAALADPIRRRIVELLAGGERSAGELVGEFDVSAPAISQHLKTLRDAGLVRVRVDAQRRIYAIDRGGLDTIDTWLQGVRKFWAKRLDALERELRKAAAADRAADTSSARQTTGNAAANDATQANVNAAKRRRAANRSATKRRTRR